MLKLSFLCQFTASKFFNLQELTPIEKPGTEDGKPVYIVPLDKLEQRIKSLIVTIQKIPEGKESLPPVQLDLKECVEGEQLLLM